MIAHAVTGQPSARHKHAVHLNQIVQLAPTCVASVCTRQWAASVAAAATNLTEPKTLDATYTPLARRPAGHI